MPRRSSTKLLALLALTACSAPPRAVEPKSELPAEPIESGDRCLRWTGDPLDPSLRGRDRTHAVRCCASDYGFDPKLARDVCGFEAYLGESEELACVHRFRADGQLHELRITPILDLELDEAVALHELSTGLTDTPAEVPAIRWSAAEGQRWAFVPGWSVVRRLGWDESACAPERMLPVLARMLAAADDPAAAGIALPRLDEHEPTPDNAVPESLLALPLEAPEPGRRYPLPRSAEPLVLDLLRAAIAHDPESFGALLEPDARIGLPDRRQLGARAILGPDGPSAAMQQLLDAAARFPSEIALRCPSFDRRVRPRVARGEALMWCFWMSDDSLDLITFALRGRVHETDADARVAYVGVFPLRPEGPLTVPGEPPPPPIVPTPELVCGDPHARSYPGLCPESEATTDDDVDEPP